MSSTTSTTATLPSFPSEPVAPEAILENFLPELFARLADGRKLPETALELGFRLDGETGGEWVYRVRDGGLGVERASRDGAALTVIQTVDDWRGALWEGRGGMFGRMANALLNGDALLALREKQGDREPDFRALEPLSRLDGLIQVVLVGDEGGDLGISVKLGPGEVPSEPNAVVRIRAEDALAIERGELDPLQAFMGGQIEVLGDMTLVLQMQAVLMQAAQPPPR
jgi:hypothetical protein